MSARPTYQVVEPREPWERVEFTKPTRVAQSISEVNCWTIRYLEELALLTFMKPSVFEWPDVTGESQVFPKKSPQGFKSTRLEIGNIGMDVQSLSTWITYIPETRISGRVENEAEFKKVGTTITPSNKIRGDFENFFQKQRMIFNRVFFPAAQNLRRHSELPVPQMESWLKYISEHRTKFVDTTPEGLSEHYAGEISKGFEKELAQIVARNDENESDIPTVSSMASKMDAILEVKKLVGAFKKISLKGHGTGPDSTTTRTTASVVSMVNFLKMYRYLFTLHDMLVRLVDAIAIFRAHANIGLVHTMKPDSKTGVFDPKTASTSLMEFLKLYLRAHAAIQTLDKRMSALHSKLFGSVNSGGNPEEEGYGYTYFDPIVWARQLARHDVFPKRPHDQLVLIETGWSPLVGSVVDAVMALTSFYNFDLAQL